MAKGKANRKHSSVQEGPSQNEVPAGTPYGTLAQLGNPQLAMSWLPNHPETVLEDIAYARNCCKQIDWPDGLLEHGRDLARQAIRTRRQLASFAKRYLEVQVNSAKAK